MRLAFFIQRAPEIKFIGGLAHDALSAGHDVQVFAQLEASHSEKPYQNLTEKYMRELENIPVRGIRGFRSTWTEILAWSPDYLVVIEAYNRLINHGATDLLQSLKRRGIKVVALSQFFEIVKYPLDALEWIDLTFYMSDFSRELHFQLQAGETSLEKTRQKYSDKTEVVGSPLFDQFSVQDEDEARAQYEIEHGKRVVVLMAPVILPTTPWRQSVWRGGSKLSRTKNALKARNWHFLPEIWTGSTFEKIVAAIREFCDANNALLIVKSRGKHDDPDYLFEAADMYLQGNEDTFFPSFTTYQLLAMADLCIGVHSMSVIEAVGAGVPSVNIYVPHWDQVAEPNGERAYYDAIYSPTEIGPFNYPGCVTQIDRRDFVSWIHTQSLDDFYVDKSAAKEYKARFLGIVDQSSTSRILTSLAAKKSDGI